jgi:periplasmic glucans biosynthesis protein
MNAMHAATVARLLLFLAAAIAPMPAALAFDFGDVAARAQALAAKPYEPGRALPAALKNLTYDRYRDIRYRPERALWRAAGLPFEVAFFHLGWHFEQPVRIHEIVGGASHEIPYDARSFDYGANKIDGTKLAGAGFAGFRVHYALNTPGYKDEVVSFLGASYFRGLGKGQRYGLSARGLAIDTAVSSGEEFPRFTEFWIERPARNATSLTIYALLDSPRATGAYRIVIAPGEAGVFEVKTRLFLRQGVGKLGIAPLTSMFFFGENQPAAREDYRPEVHDSDGLSVLAGNGEWLWRPLVNPKRLLVTSFATENPRGFGLMQRDRHFAHYEDLEARYELRPSAWIEPKGDWGKGRIELVQLPSPDETNDNIVAFWVPERLPAKLEPFDLEYRILWQGERARHPPLAWVAQTRRGRGYTAKPDDSIGFVIDFHGPLLERLPRDAPIEAVVSTDGNGAVVETVAHRHDANGGARLAARIRRADKAKPVELRAFLKIGDRSFSETWSYVLPPD